MDTMTAWEAYREAGDTDTRDRLIAENLGLVHHIARQLLASAPPEAEMGDLVSAGTMGLMAAIENFDPGRGLAFSTFAAPRIRGAILDDLRRWDPMPRSIRRKQRQLKYAREELAQSLDREPTDAELAAELDMPVEQIDRWRHDLEGLNSVSLDQPVRAERGAEATSLYAILGDDAQDASERVNREQELGLLRTAIGDLPEKERIVLSLYYYEELKMHEIAVVLGVTESRISQIRTKALRTLRASLSCIGEEYA